MVRGRMHGIARYALELARRLPKLAPDWEFIGLTGPSGLDVTPSLEIPLQRCAAEFLSPLEQPALLASLLKVGCDLFHATSFSLPALWIGRLVTTLHDVNHLALPENYGLGRVPYYRLVVGPRAKSARAVLTDSEFSCQEISRYLGLPVQKIQVIHPGVDDTYCPALEAEVEGFLSAHHLPAHYFAVVGSTKKHKNLKLIADLAPSLPAPVVLLAGAGAKSELGFPPSAIEIASLPEDAMACGCPVVAARGSSLTELVGDAGILLSPDQPAGWIAAATRLFNEAGLRRRLGELGRARAQGFSWDRCAEQVLAVYGRAL